MTQLFQLTTNDLISNTNAGICVTDRELVGYKKILCRNNNIGCHSAIAVLLIPSGSTVVKTIFASEYYSCCNDHKQEIKMHTKLRANKAIITGIYLCDSNNCETNMIDNLMTQNIFCSVYDSKFIYEIGKVCEPVEPLDMNVGITCAPGIHFFLDRSSAWNYCNQIIAHMK